MNCGRAGKTEKSQVLVLWNPYNVVLKSFENERENEANLSNSF
jgi:hypothetical protein